MMKKIFFISALVLALMTSFSCKKDEGTVTDEGLLITAVKTRCDMPFSYKLKTVSYGTVGTSDGSYNFYSWDSCEDLKLMEAQGWCERMACAYPTVYGENYTHLKIEANKPVNAKVVYTAESENCVSLIPSNDGKSFEVRYDSEAEGNGAVYILVQSTEGESSKLLSIGAYKTLPQIMDAYPTTLSYESYKIEGKDTTLQQAQSVEAIVKDTISMFSVTEGDSVVFKGIKHKFISDYDVHNYCVISRQDTIGSEKTELIQTPLIYTGNKVGIRTTVPGYITIEIRSRLVNGDPGAVKSQYFLFQVKKKE